MVTTQAHTTISRIRGSALLLALVALVVLPPLLCATPHHSASPRLVRGLEEPPGKGASAIASAAYVGPVSIPGFLQAVAPIAPPPEPPHAIVGDIAEAIPQITLDGSFDPRRGPPAA